MEIGILILMGGKNTRMGGFIKGLLSIGKQNFLEKITSNIGNISNTYLSLNNNFDFEDIKNYEDMGLKIVLDIHEEIGPIGGIYSALKKCSEDYLFVTTCDMPFMNKEFIDYLSSYLNDEVDVVTCYNRDGKMYPLGAIYSKKVIPIIEKMIEEKCYKLTRLIYASNYIEIAIEGTPFSAEIFTNINTPEDYRLFIENNVNTI